LIYFEIKNTLNYNLKHTVYNSWQLLMVMVTNTCVNFGINQPNLKDEKELYINITGNTTFHLKKKIKRKHVIFMKFLISKLSDFQIF
jgi:hypothetical protein